MSDVDVNFDAALDKVKDMTSASTKTDEPVETPVDNEVEAKLARLAELEAKEAERVQAEEDARKSDTDKRITEIENQRKLDKESYEAKLETLSTRMSSPAQGTDGKKALTEEEYLANQAEYDRMLIKNLTDTGKF